MSKLPSGSPSSSGGDSGSDCDDPSDPLSCYEFVGIGVCADSQVPQLSDALPFIVYARSADLSSPSDCASKCTECVNGAVSNGSFRGFTLDSGACMCHLDDEATPNPNPGVGCTYGFYCGGIDCGGVFGTGEILGVYFSSSLSDALCYKYKLLE